MAFLDDEFPRWVAKRTLLAGCDLGSVLALGDSRAAIGIAPNALPVTATNLALAGSTPIEAYVVAGRALHCPTPPRRVVMSFTPPHFAAPDTFWGKTARYRFLGRDDLEDVYRSSARLGDFSVFTLEDRDHVPPHIRIWMYSTYFPSIYFSSLFQNGVFLRESRNRALEARVLAARGQYFFGTGFASDRIAAEGRQPHFLVSPIIGDYFDRVIDRFAAAGIEVDFLPMPVNDATGRAILDTYRDEFAAFLRRTAKTHGNFHVIGTPMPSWPNRYFNDPLSHLNADGVAVFNAVLGRCLAALQGGGEVATDPDCAAANARPAPL